MANPRVFFDITANGNLLGRVVMEVRNIDIIYILIFFSSLLLLFRVMKWTLDGKSGCNFLLCVH